MLLLKYVHIFDHKRVASYHGIVVPLFQALVG